MRDLNIDFMDLYKSVDRFIRQAYGSSEGVSEYIRLMEQNGYTGGRYVISWRNDYDMLKHLRWIRNQLSHEVGYDSNICEESDYNWLYSFRERLYSTDDPLSVMRKTEEAERQRLLAANRIRKAQIREQQPRKPQNAQSDTQQIKKRKTFWQKIKALFFRK